MNQKFIFLGAPGVGKGTFAKLLAKKYELFHLSPGEMLRKEVSTASALGREVQAFVNAGKLVPDQIVNKIIIKTLKQLPLQRNGFILDGYPRSLTQAKYLHEQYVVPQASPITAINITLNRSVTIQKLLGRRLCRTCGGSFNIADIMDNGYDMPAILPTKENCPFLAKQDTCHPQFEKRDDDTEEIIRYRLESYDQSIQSILDYYEQQRVLKHFDVKRGVKDTEDLWEVMKK